MGLCLFSNGNTNTPNPNPLKYSIISIEHVGKYDIVVARYDGCTTFGGRKLLLLRGQHKYTALDPHLLGNDHIVMARFEPTAQGLGLARLCAKSLNGD